MKKQMLSAALVALLAVPALAQNLAVVNGKPVPTEVLPDFFDESTMRYHKHRRETLGAKPQVLW